MTNFVTIVRPPLGGKDLRQVGDANFQNNSFWMIRLTEETLSEFNQRAFALVFVFIINELVDS